MSQYYSYTNTYSSLASILLASEQSTPKTYAYGRRRLRDDRASGYSAIHDVYIYGWRVTFFATRCATTVVSTGSRRTPGQQRRRRRRRRSSSETDGSIRGGPEGGGPRARQPPLRVAAEPPEGRWLSAELAARPQRQRSSRRRRRGARTREQ
jgi:hypothetical protein